MKKSWWIVMVVGIAIVFASAALYAGTAEQVANWAGTRATRLLDEQMVPVCSPALAASLGSWRDGRHSRLFHH